MAKEKKQLVSLIKEESIVEKFSQLKGEKGAKAFLLSVLNVAEKDEKLKKADPDSILYAAAVAATLNLPIDPNLGQAYIIGYRGKAQFQIGYKGLIQLCHRSNKFKTINVTNVKEKEVVLIDRLTGQIDFDWNQDQDKRNKMKTIGFVAFFGLNNGFEKLLYMTVKEVNDHAKKYSKTYGKNDSQWSGDGYEGMAKKTVLKLLLDKFAPKTVEMTKAIQSDQAVIEDFEGNLNYIDNPQNETTEERNERKLVELKEFYENNTFKISFEEQTHIQRIIDNKEILSYHKAMKVLNENIIHE